MTATLIPTFTTADRLRKAREVAGLDQRQLGEAMGVARQTVSNYESGHTTNVRRIILNAWALATGVPVEWLRDGTEPTNGPTDGGAAGEQGNTPTGGDVGSIADRTRRDLRNSRIGGNVVPMPLAS